MFEQAFKNIDDVLRKEAGCTTELDYTEQTSEKLQGRSFPAICSALGLSVELGIARELTGRRRNRHFMYDRHLSILDQGTKPP